MRMTALITALGATALFLAGCASKEEPATLAVQTSEAALNEARPELAKYVPEQLPAVEDKLAALKNDLASKHYAAVLAAAPKFREELHSLQEASVAKQTQLAAAANEWQELSEEVPLMVDAIQQRVDDLKSSRLPENLNKESFEAAKSELATMKATWAEASAAFSAGNATEAADKGRLVQAKAKEVSEQLGMSPV